MEKEQEFIGYIEQSIIQNWNLNALTDYNGVTLQYKDVARKIAKFHIAMEMAGIKPGDKIAVCGRNSAHWGVAYLAIVTYGAVVVPILHEFKADNIHNIVNHSETQLLFVGDQIWENLNEEAMPFLKGIISLADFSLLVSRSEELSYGHGHRNEIFGKRYPSRFSEEHVSYKQNTPDDLALINYTSGTTGFSKGVMLNYRCLLSNVLYCQEMTPLKPGDRTIAILPMGHVFGMTYDFLYGIFSGVHIHFLTRIPSPKVIAQACADIKPNLICCVPLVVEKIIKKDILPKLDSTIGKLLLRVPIINDRLKATARQAAIDIFGGEFDEIIVGGAPLNKEVEAFLMKIGFPITVGYGMTECGPLISSERWEDHKLYSCGTPASRMTVKIDSDDPENIPGEILCKGDNLMIGYYKNPEATAQAIDEDGWLHTGDLATMDAAGHITIRGRQKSVLMGASGQNIYPEEIESKLNNMPFVSESLVVMQNDKIVALIYPDFDEAFAQGLQQTDIDKVMETNRAELNQMLPKYCQIAKVKIHFEEFEKTAKKSIKRFMYQEVKE
ncbi:long-chain fatty acid--CoA ligase [Bacteroides sp. 519]|uniref:long-chain fatty acid--CoA ligase n=1 Tax=Bacteroides sp. 519 TaxID=2302937 RepID=UPI0013D5F314|nr:long-chain fatty acid--CoA ligase [Bacteroides sp. 519]NDV58603.1 long-chain fatty acid--CoA ligase [Bacteroides sp. 519]